MTQSTLLQSSANRRSKLVGLTVLACLAISQTTTSSGQSPCGIPNGLKSAGLKTTLCQNCCSDSKKWQKQTSSAGSLTLTVEIDPKVINEPTIEPPNVVAVDGRHRIQFKGRIHPCVLLFDGFAVAIERRRVHADFYFTASARPVFQYKRTPKPKDGNFAGMDTAKQNEKQRILRQRRRSSYPSDPAGTSILNR